jgi:hypothetical protein
VDNYNSLSGSHQWNVSFLRSLNDWEVEDLASFYSLLYSYTLGGALTKFGGFQVGRGSLR